MISPTPDGTPLPHAHQDPIALEKVRSIVQACHARLGRPLPTHELDEAIQQTAIDVWRRRTTASGRVSEDAWIYGVARIAILDQVRRRCRQENIRHRVFQGHERVEGETPATAIDTDFCVLVRSEVKRVGTTDAIIVERRLVDDLSFRIIGRDLELTESATKSRFYRAIPGLRQQLGHLWDAIRKR